LYVVCPPIQQLQEWESNKPFLQDRRCTHGALAWSLFMRGLMFDIRASLLNPVSTSEAREVIRYDRHGRHLHTYTMPTSPLLAVASRHARAHIKA
jgi:hypothetical protein